MIEPPMLPQDLLNNTTEKAWVTRDQVFLNDDLPHLLDLLGPIGREPGPWLPSMAGDFLGDAVDRGAQRIVHWLLTTGVDPNQRLTQRSRNFVSQETPLHVAAQHARADLVGLLLDHGADPSLKTVEVMRVPGTPLSCALQVWGEHRRQPLAHLIDQREGLIDVAQVLKRLVPVTPLDTTPIRGPGVLMKDEHGRLLSGSGFTPSSNTLAQAVWADHGAGVNALIEQGMDPMCEDGRPLWRYALEGNRGSVLYALQKRGLGPEPGWRDAQGNTPLHLAVIGVTNTFPSWRPSPVTLGALMRRDTVLERNHAGQTPLDLLRAWPGDHTVALTVLGQVEAQTLRHDLREPSDDRPAQARRGRRL